MSTKVLKTILILAVGVVLLASAAPLALADDPHAEGWFSCYSCEAFTEVFGIVTAATLIAVDPEGAAAEEAMDVIFHGMHHYYGGDMNLQVFIRESKEFCGPLSVAKFVIEYPKFICYLFDKCDHP